MSCDKICNQKLWDKVCIALYRSLLPTFKVIKLGSQAMHIRVLWQTVQLVCHQLFKHCTFGALDLPAAHTQHQVHPVHQPLVPTSAEDHSWLKILEVLTLNCLRHYHAALLWSTPVHQHQRQAQGQWSTIWHGHFVFHCWQYPSLLLWEMSQEVVNQGMASYQVLKV